jgi:hypothetical protein
VGERLRTPRASAEKEEVSQNRASEQRGEGKSRSTEEQVTRSLLPRRDLVPFEPICEPARLSLHPHLVSRSPLHHRQVVAGAHFCTLSLVYRSTTSRSRLSNPSLPAFNSTRLSQLASSLFLYSAEDRGWQDLRITSLQDGEDEDEARAVEEATEGEEGEEDEVATRASRPSSLRLRRKGRKMVTSWRMQRYVFCTAAAQQNYRAARLT